MANSNGENYVQYNEKKKRVELCCGCCGYVIDADSTSIFVPEQQGNECDPCEKNEECVGDGCQHMSI